MHMRVSRHTSVLTCAASLPVLTPSTASLGYFGLHRATRQPEALIQCWLPSAFH